MKVNTSRPKQLAKKNLNKVRLRYLAQKDISRFSRTASFSIFDDGYEQVVSRIMYNVHALEKGLARNRDIRLGFGKKALSNLNDALVVYRLRRYDETAYAYAQGVWVIQRYKELHAKQDFDVVPRRDHRCRVPQPRHGLHPRRHQDGPQGRQGTQLREELLRDRPGPAACASSPATRSTPPR